MEIVRSFIIVLVQVLRVDRDEGSLVIKTKPLTTTRTSTAVKRKTCVNCVRYRTLPVKRIHVQTNGTELTDVVRTEGWTKARY